MNEEGKGDLQRIKTGDDVSPSLQSPEQALHFIAFFVPLPIINPMEMPDLTSGKPPVPAPFLQPTDGVHRLHPVCPSPEAALSLAVPTEPAGPVLPGYRPLPLRRSLGDCFSWCAYLIQLILDHRTVNRQNFHLALNDILTLQLGKHTIQFNASRPTFHASIAGVTVSETFRQTVHSTPVSTTYKMTLHLDR